MATTDSVTIEKMDSPELPFIESYTMLLSNNGIASVASKMMATDNSQATSDRDSALSRKKV